MINTFTKDYLILKSYNLLSKIEGRVNDVQRRVYCTEVFDIEVSKLVAIVANRWSCKLQSQYET